MLPTMGVEAPSDIQMQAIPAILKGDTLAMQAYTGSGKVRGCPSLAAQSACSGSSAVFSPAQSVPCFLLRRLC